MNALDFNNIDKFIEKDVALNSLSFPEKIGLLESQIHTIYDQWNNSNLKINKILSSFNSSPYNKSIFGIVV